MQGCRLATPFSQLEFDKACRAADLMSTKKKNKPHVWKKNYNKSHLSKEFLGLESAPDLNTMQQIKLLG